MVYPILMEAFQYAAFCACDNINLHFQQSVFCLRFIGLDKSKVVIYCIRYVAGFDFRLYWKYARREVISGLASSVIFALAFRIVLRDRI